MKCKHLIFRLISLLFLQSAVLSFTNQAHASSISNVKDENKVDAFRLFADYVEIIIDVSTDADRKKYEKDNVPKENIEILMMPKIRAFLNKKYFSDFNNWNLMQIAPDVFQFKHKTWSDCFFHVNLAEPAVYKVTKAELGQLDGLKERLDIQDIRQNEASDWVIHLPQPHVNLDEHSGKTYLIWQGLPLSETNDFQARKINAKTFHLKHSYWNSRFLEVDFQKKEVWQISNGKFGESGGSRYAMQGMYPLAPQEQLISPKEPKPTKNGTQSDSSQTLSAFWPVDIALELPNDYPPSQWLTKQANLFQDILTSKHYDTLLFPLQVDGYAIDHAGRFLITLMIHQRLLESGCSLPNPMLFARALGEEKRTLSQERVFQLAAQLGAKEIIIPMAGHNSRNQLKVRFLKMVAADNGQFTVNGRVFRAEKSNLPFSDITPPSLVIAPLLDELLQGINVKLAPRKAMVANGFKQPAGLPHSPIELFEKTDASLLENALFLQLTGVLHPNASFARDGLFGRSLVAAWELPPKDSNRPLLIARALFYLHRRPAALEALGKPRNPEEQAFLAYLNGDLVSLKESRKRIEAPLPKLLANLEYQDLLIEYTGKPLDENALGAIAQPFPGWEALITRKLLGKWTWATQPNLAVKEMMDQAFPIEGFTAQGLVTSRLALGMSPLEGSEVELCAYEHYQQILKREGTNLYGHSSIAQVSNSDLLQLLYETSEANLINTVYKSVRMRGLADEALEKIRKYDPVYTGLPTLTHLEGEALSLKAKNSRGAEQAEFEKRARQLQAFSAYWGLKQVSFAYNKAFDLDFPKRYYWVKGGQNSESIASLENSLLYTNEKFHVVKRLCEFYERSGHEEQMEDLLSRLGNRFVGHPDRQILLADSYAIKGDTENAKKYLQQAIQILPDVWAPHAKLTDLAIHDGQIDEAFKMASHFEPFAEEEPPNSVALSRNAYTAAMKFFLLGEVDNALPLFEVAQKFQTGSSPEMLSAAYMGLAEGDFQKAGYHFLRGARRYQESEFLSGYLELLHLMGMHDQAWTVFNNLPPHNKSPEVYGAALYGMRIEGKTDQDMLDWICRQDQNTGISGFYLHKIIDSNKAQLKEIFEKGMPKPRNGHLSYNAQQGFMQIYIHHRIGDYEKGDKFLKKQHGDDIFITDLPYAPFYFNHFGQLEKFRRLLAEFKEIKGVSFFELLAEGVVAGLDGKSETALDFFRKSRLNISLDDTYHLPPLYQLAETCEWFFEQTKERSYLDAALDYARWHNRQDPTDAWPYTFLAKYSSTDSERLMALGRAVYLAPDSDRISAFSLEEKQKALELFKKDNVFTKQPSKVDTIKI